MTQPPEVRESNSQGRFSSLEYQLQHVPAVARRIVKKHWPKAEREQYPFWVGIIVIALAGIFGMYLAENATPEKFNTALIWLALLMLGSLIALVYYHFKKLAGRFDRQWQAMTMDGELFRFLRDAAMMLGFPIELGKPDERMKTRIDKNFPEVAKAVEHYLRSSAITDPDPKSTIPGLIVSENTFESNPGGESRRIYDAEYRGSIIRAFSIRIDALEPGADITVGFTLRGANAQTRESLETSLMGRLQDRFIAAVLLAHIREAVGAEPESIQVTESIESVTNPATSRAI